MRLGGASRAGALALCLGILPGVVSVVAAHDLPDQIALSAFVRTEAGRADLLVRVPLTLLMDLDLPKYGPGYLDLARIGPHLERAAEAVGRALVLLDGETAPRPVVTGARISLPSDRSFERYELAAAAIHGPPLPATETLYATQGFFDVHFVYAVGTGAADLALRLRLPPALGDRTRLGLRYLTPGGAVRAFDIHGSVADVRLDPRWHQAAALFVREGVEHILGGADHLLFLLCLVLPFRRRLGRLLGVVTAFTLGHSITLMAAALGLVPTERWFAPAVETTIAASIVYMAVENVVGVRLDHRWVVAAAFGLVHGFGFAGALAGTLQFAGAHLLISLLSFNLGIELGQVLVLLVAVPLLDVLFRLPLLAQYGSLLVSVLVGHEAWHWMVERAGAIRRTDLPPLDFGTVYGLILWTVIAAFVALLAWTLVPAAWRRAREG
jgi:hypothetical protein